jgi:hypothetical protein
LEGKGVKDCRLIASMSDGSLAIANKLSENPASTEIVKLVFDLLKNLRSSQDILKYSSKILALKKDFVFFMDTMITVLRDISVFGISGNIVFKDNVNGYQILSDSFNKTMIVKIIDKITQIPNKINFNCNMTAIVDQMLLDILEVKFLWQK